MEMHPSLEKLVDQPIIREIKQKSASVQREFFLEKTLEFIKNSQKPEVSFIDDVVTINKVDLNVRIYTPKNINCDGAIFYIHGGGWTLGSIETYHLICLWLAEYSCAKLISIEYRLAPEHKFPAAVLDAYGLTDWLFHNGNNFKINPNKIIIAGDSAGGNLATVVCHLRKQKKLALPCAQILIYPSCDISKKRDSYSRYSAHKHSINTEWLRWFFDNYANNIEDKFDPRLSPLLFTNHSGLPDTLLVVAEHDPLVDEINDYKKALTLSGNTVEVLSYPNMIHGFLAYIGIIDESLDAIKKIGLFASHQFNKVD